MKQRFLIIGLVLILLVSGVYWAYLSNKVKIIQYVRNETKLPNLPARNQTVESSGESAVNNTLTKGNDPARSKWNLISWARYVQGLVVAVSEQTDGLYKLTLKVEVNYHNGTDPVNTPDFPFNRGQVVDFYLKDNPRLDFKQVKRVIVYEGKITTDPGTDFLGAVIRYYEKDGNFFDLDGKQVSLPPQDYSFNWPMDDKTETGSDISLTSEEKMPQQMPANFQFVLKYGVGAKNVLDTSKDTFTKDLVTAGTATTKLRLTPGERLTIYEQMRDIDILSYPEVIKPLKGITVTPNVSYSLTISFGNIKKSIYWDSMSELNGQRSDELRNLISNIMTLIESKKEYKKLPPARGGYA
ncbi:MAG: hypothetical protein ACYC2T_02045 [Bacillota bacterium]